MSEKYNPSNLSVDQILRLIEMQEIAIPEIQRPFAWRPKKVLDLIDSLFYIVYPTGYVVISQTQYIKPKVWSLCHDNKKIFDFNMRETAFVLSIFGKVFIDSEFLKKWIEIF